ncbi:TetR/AcrR family transcriptional regulator [Gordonia bronchialis]|uniref:TetR/AcrR family transcriptional regulator n=1 Tax=Gordonia bronchialis TaxID=2054 RepID=UPI0021D9EA54|nr:TetR/AcrR family transcriptional regulator [Gordonia bronchialis]
MALGPFEKISVAQVLTEAAVSRATFYSYFPSRTAVLRGFLERAMSDLFRTVSPFLERGSGDEPVIALERSLRAVTHGWHTPDGPTSGGPPLADGTRDQRTVADDHTAIR